MNNENLSQHPPDRLNQFHQMEWETLLAQERQEQRDLQSKHRQQQTQLAQEEIHIRQRAALSDQQAQEVIDLKHQHSERRIAFRKQQTPSPQTNAE